MVAVLDSSTIIISLQLQLYIPIFISTIIPNHSSDISCIPSYPFPSNITYYSILIPKKKKMMCFVKLFFVVVLFTSLFSSHASKEHDKMEDVVMLTSLRGRRGFFSYKFKPFQAAMTCDRNIKVCRAEGSPGRNCCQKKCVDLKRDRYNCGRCGRKCKYSEVCCKGKCVNTMFNRKHCGGCNNKCNRGSLCVYGMCGYA